MKRHILILGIILTSFTACTEDPGCQPCSAVITTEMEGEVIQTANMTMTDLCGDQLQSVLENPTQVVTASSMGVEQTVTTVYTCE